MRARDRLGNFLAFLFWMIVVMPGAIKAQKAAESKVDPPRAGINGVTSPICIYCPLPVTEKSRKAKISGVVLLDVIVTADGRVTKPVVLKGLSSGLDESALEAAARLEDETGSRPGWQTCKLSCTSRSYFQLYWSVATL